MIKGYFIDLQGIIYTVADFYEGGSNAPYHIEVEGDSVYECHVYQEGDGWQIDETYTLHSTLRDLAFAVEEK